MSKILRYFLFSSLVLSVLFLASCGDDDGELPLGDASLTLTQGDSTVTTVNSAPGEDVVVTVEIDYGGETVESLTVYNDDGTVANTYPLSGQTSLQVTYAVPENATGTLEIVFEISDADGALDSETLTITLEAATVADVVINSEDHDILEAALTEADLVTALQGEGPFTVFAPTDDAFAAAGIGSEADFPETDILASILQYHVVPGLTLSDDLGTGYYTTLSGDSVYISVTDDGIFVNGAEVTAPDITAGNGVVHVINEVLLPNITSYEAFLLAAPTGDETSETFFSTSTGEIYSYDEVTSTSASISPTIDFGYYYGLTANATLASPDAYPQEIYSGLAGWDVRNNTVFRSTTLTAEGFDAIAASQGDDLEAEFEAGTDLDNSGRAIGLAAGDVLAFQTENGRFGLIKVIEVIGSDGAGDGIQIAVKVTSD